MTLINEYFDEHNKALINRLIAVEFSIDQARQFLPDAILELCRASKNCSEFQAIACLFSKSQYQLLRVIDVDAIARNTGINNDMVITGLRAIAPLLLQAYAQKCNDLQPIDSFTTEEEPV